MSALHARSPTPAETLGLVDAILEFDPELRHQLQTRRDIGTGRRVVAITGSGKETFKTFNVSTTAAFVAAVHPDLCVIKPAGQATSATTGASDVLESLGIHLPTSLTQVRTMAGECGIGVFDYHLVAPRYGPRYEGRFHHLHPLSYVTPWLFIPFRVDGIVFGIAGPQVELAATIMALSGIAHGAVVTTDLGAAGRIDEYAPFGTALLASISEGAVRTTRRDRETPTDLRSIQQRADHAQNATIVLDVLRGQGPDLASQLVYANAALILEVAGLAADHHTALTMAEGFVRSGDALARLDACRASGTPSGGLSG